MFIESTAYYDVFGSVEKEFSIQRGDYTVSFKRNEDINVGHETDDEYFWIILEASIPFVLDEEYEYSYIEPKNIL